MNLEMRMSDLFCVHGKVGFTPFPFLFCFVLFSSNPYCSNCSNVVIIAKIIQIPIKLRVFSLQKTYFTGCPNTGVSGPGPVKPPRLHSWHSFMRGVKGLSTTWSTSCETDQRTLFSLGGSGLSNCPSSEETSCLPGLPCFSSQRENDTSSFLHTHLHIGDAQTLERHTLLALLILVC